MNQPRVSYQPAIRKIKLYQLSEALEVLCFVLICAQCECERKTEAPTHVSIDALLWRATAFGL